MIANVETQKVAMSLRTFIVIIMFVGAFVACYFKTLDGINSRMDGINARIDQTNRLIESQNNLIISGRYKDSIDRIYIQTQIDYLKEAIKK